MSERVEKGMKELIGILRDHHNQRYWVPCDKTTKDVNLVSSGLVVGFIECKNYIKPEKNIFYRCRITGDPCIYQTDLDHKKILKKLFKRSVEKEFCSSKYLNSVLFTLHHENFNRLYFCLWYS